MACPVLVESHEGRPTKIEGNPEHPASMGGTDVFMQASILDMYDPDRSQNVTYLGEFAIWERTRRRWGALNSQRALKGSGLRILTRTVSPTIRVADESRDEGVSAGEVDPVRTGGTRQRARRRADGVRAVRRYALSARQGRRHSRARWRLSSPAAIPASCFTHGSLRRGAIPICKEKMSRFYSVQSTPTNTSGKADHRCRCARRKWSRSRAPSLPESAWVAVARLQPARRSS